MSDRVSNYITVIKALDLIREKSSDTWARDYASAVMKKCGLLAELQSHLDGASGVESPTQGKV